MRDSHIDWSFRGYYMEVRRYKIYFRVECCLSEYCCYNFLFIMWMKLCKLNQTCDQCEKPNGKKKKQGHAYIWDLWCPIFSYYWKYELRVCWCLVKGWHPYLKHFRINVSDLKIEQCFDDSLSSLWNSNYVIELIVYIVLVVWKYVRNWKGIKVFKCYVKSLVQIELDYVKFWFYAPGPSCSKPD